jgi:hypothetical protein
MRFMADDASPLLDISQNETKEAFSKRFARRFGHENVPSFCHKTGEFLNCDHALEMYPNSRISALKTARFSTRKEARRVMRSRDTNNLSTLLL